MLAFWGMLRSMGRFYGLGTPAWAGVKPVVENQAKVNVGWPPGETRLTVGNLSLREPSVVYTWAYTQNGGEGRQGGFKTILYVNAPRRKLEETRQRLQEFFPDRSFPEDIAKLK